MELMSMRPVGLMISKKKEIQNDKKTEFQINKLLSKLSRRFPTLFPFSKWNLYDMINDKNIDHFSLIIAFSINNELNEEIKHIENKCCIKVLKIKELSNTYLNRRERFIKRQERFKVRTNYQLVNIYKRIEDEIKNYLS